MTEKEYTAPKDKLNVRHYPRDTIIIKENTQDDGSIYILERGKLGVFKGKGVVTELSEVGVIVGEMASIRGTPRTATIKTLTECEMTVYTGDLRRRLIERLPPVTQRIVTAITQRLQRQTEDHAVILSRTENLERENQQLRQEVDDLTRQLATLKKVQAD